MDISLVHSIAKESDTTYFHGWNHKITTAH